MKFRIMTPDETTVEVEAASVTLPSVDGQLTAMDGHDTLIAMLKPGNIHCTRIDERGATVRDDFNADAGFAEVTANTVTVCVSKAKVVESEGNKKKN